MNDLGDLGAKLDIKYTCGRGQVGLKARPENTVCVGASLCSA